MDALRVLVANVPTQGDCFVAEVEAEAGDTVVIFRWLHGHLIRVRLMRSEYSPMVTLIAREK